MKTISIVTPCYNEKDNVRGIYESVKHVMESLNTYEYEHIFIDNDSKDGTQTILREMAKGNKNVKLIFNSRNFGETRSPLYAMFQSRGDAVISLVADFQDPPELIGAFIRKWEEGYKIVIGVKSQSEEPAFLFALRRAYYNLVARLSAIELSKNFSGFGLYDRKIIEVLRSIDDPYPYFRGLICDIGFDRAEIEYTQPVRKSGITKNNMYSLYDHAMLGITNHTKVPLRLATMLGFCLSIACLLIAGAYFVAKLIFWNTYTIGTAPVIVGVFFFASVQLMFTGILGEYIGAIYTQVLKRPLVIEKERINF